MRGVPQRPLLAAHRRGGLGQGRAGPRRGRGPVRARDRRRAREAAARARGAPVSGPRRLRVGGRRRRRRVVGPAVAARRGAVLGARVPARPDHDRVLAVHALPGDGLRGQGGLRLRRAPRGRRGRGLEVPRRARDGRVRGLFAAAPAARDGWF